MSKTVIGCLAAVAVVLGIVVMLGLALAGSYNSLVSLSQEVDKQWAQVENVYQRRADLVPNLVSTVSGAANFEKSTLVEVTRARASVAGGGVSSAKAPTDPAQLQAFEQTQGQLTSALSRLLVVVEKYPDLKANQNFRDLQAQLEGTENRIAVERGRFNEVVQSYNTTVKQFPTVFIARLFGFAPRPFFTASSGAETPPKVEFDLGGKPAN
jgi:LemA protein